jgi:hypothetical protein
LEGTESTSIWSVNLDPIESQTAPLPAEIWSRFGAPVGRASPATPSRTSTTAAATETEGQQKLWRWFLLGTWAILIVESVIARWTRTHQAIPTPSPA